MNPNATARLPLMFTDHAFNPVLHRTAQIEYGNGLPLLARHRHFFLFYLMTAGQPHFAYSLKEKWRDEKKDGPLQGDSLQEKLEKNRFDSEQWTQRQKPF